MIRASLAALIGVIRRDRWAQRLCTLVMVVSVAIGIVVGFAAWYQADTQHPQTIPSESRPLSKTSAIYYSMGTFSTAGAPFTSDPHVRRIIILQEAIDFIFVSIVVASAINFFSR
jgi:hypothetical protein